MRKAVVAVLSGLALVACVQAAPGDTSGGDRRARDGMLIERTYPAPDFGDGAARTVSIWLPPGYEDSEARYPVIYAHDGQNLFVPGRSYTGDEWGVDETLGRLAAEGAVRPAIVVGVWNNPTRWRDYAPFKVTEALPSGVRDAFYTDNGGAPFSDGYVRFLADVLKPDIDAAYRTKTGPEDTLLLGSSMGGLISLYAAGTRPDVFGGAAMLSIHWPLGDPRKSPVSAATQAMQDWLDASALAPDQQRLWFDRGTETLDSTYEPYAAAMEDYFDKRGWPAEFRVYPGTEHNEAAWAARLSDPLIFLLAKGGD